MGLWDRIKDFFKKQAIIAQKDNVLAMAIHYIITEELKWYPKKVHFGSDKHEMEYVKPNSPLNELEIKAERVGNKLYLKFEGELKRGGTLGSLLEMAFDIELDREIEHHIVLNLSDFVNDNLEIINENELRNIIKSYIEKIEEKAKK